MKPYLLSLGAGLLIGILYSLMGVRSPAPPIIALIGLAGILAGEQVVPIAKRWIAPQLVQHQDRHQPDRHQQDRQP